MALRHTPTFQYFRLYRGGVRVGVLPPLLMVVERRRGIHKSTDKSVAREVGECPASNEGLMPIIEADLVLFLHK